jgi:2-oxoisovalerate dehydrogenase E1 component
MGNSSLNWHKVARQVLRSRLLDKLEVEQLTPQGLVKYQFSAMGHELAQVLLANALTHAHDAATVYYRSRPFALAAGLSVTEALAGALARSGSITNGREVGIMFNLPCASGLSILPASGDVGAQYTPAAGWAQAVRYRQQELEEADWQGSIAVAMGGEGSAAANGFWAALNLATTTRLPLLFFIEDNSFGLSVPSDLQTPGGNIAANLSSFCNLRVEEADGTDPQEAWEKISTAVEHVRQGEGPCLLRMRVVRLTGHTFIDNQAYKSPEFRQEEARRDPVVRLQEFLAASPERAIDWRSLEQEVEQEIQEALQAALAYPEPDPGSAVRHLYYEGAPPLMGGLRPDNDLPVLPCMPDPDRSPQPGLPLRMNLIDAVRHTLEVEMVLNPRLLVFGEDVGVKGGVHGATAHMQERYGPERVFDTSLNEDGIIGRAAGMAYAGLLPVPEIQFRKYADPATEQLNDLGTVRWRTANRFAAPLVVRIPVGFSKKTGDPWHSVTAEATFAHSPGWRIAFPSNARDAVGLLRSALRGDDPTFFFEHRALLDSSEARAPYPGDQFCLPFGKGFTVIEGDELVVVTWGAMVHRCVQAAQAFPCKVQVIDLRSVLPWDQELVLESVRCTGKVLVVHEDTLTAGFAGEIIATIASQAFTDLDAPVERLGAPDVPVPYNMTLMNTVVPTVEKIQAAMQRLLEF